MGDIFAIALVAVIAATLYELRWAAVAAISVYAFFRLARYLIEQWKGYRARSRYDRAAILARADRQHREVMAGDPHGVYGTDRTQIVFRDVAASLAEETGGFTRPIPVSCGCTGGICEPYNSRVYRMRSKRMSGIIGRTCPECGDHFTTNRIDRHYCSDDCRNGQPVPPVTTTERGFIG